MDELNSLLYERSVNELTTSVLCEKERVNLRELALKTKGMQEKFRDNEMNTVLRRDKKEVYEAVVKPAQEMDHGLDEYSLDLISSYADHQCDPAKWNSTLVGYWNKSYHDCGSHRRKRGLKDTLTSHATLIAIISPDEKVQRVLGEALASYQKERKLKGFEKFSIYKPQRREYDGMAGMLKDRANKEESDGFCG